MPFQIQPASDLNLSTLSLGDNLVDATRSRSESVTLMDMGCDVVAKFVQETGEKQKTQTEIWQSFSRIFGFFSFQGKSTFSRVSQIKFFHCCNSGSWGAQAFGQFKIR